MSANKELEAEAFDFFWNQFMAAFPSMSVDLQSVMKHHAFYSLWMSRAGLHAIVNETEYIGLVFDNSPSCFPIFRKGNPT